MRLRSIGRLRLIPSTLALMAVQRQTAASSRRRSASAASASAPAASASAARGQGSKCKHSPLPRRARSLQEQALPWPPLQIDLL
uniref:Uncharacterized protein n=1 Tax=Leersia perrieri TaxID=77586 RepID=A0A0D9XM87_9ORYZ